MGGMVGQGLAIRHPALLKGLVLANTTSQYPSTAAPVWAQRIGAVQSGGMAAVADMVVERYLHADFRAAHPQTAQALREQLLRCDPKGYIANCHAVAAVDWLDRLPQVKLPTLVIAGALDVGATPAMAQSIAQAIPGAKLEVFDDASHLSVAEVPERFAETVRSFLAGLP
jgi:3-oxoadipate enol-lactonase